MEVIHCSVKAEMKRAVMENSIPAVEKVMREPIREPIADPVTQ